MKKYIKHTIDKKYSFKNSKASDWVFMIAGIEYRPLANNNIPNRVQRFFIRYIFGIEIKYKPLK